MISDKVLLILALFAFQAVSLFLGCLFWTLSWSLTSCRASSIATLVVKVRNLSSISVMTHVCCRRSYHEQQFSLSNRWCYLRGQGHHLEFCVGADALIHVWPSSYSSPRLSFWVVASSSLAFVSGHGHLVSMLRMRLLYRHSKSLKWGRSLLVQWFQYCHFP